MKSQIHITQILLILLTRIFVLTMQNNVTEQFKLFSPNLHIPQIQGQQQYSIDLRNYYNGILKDISSYDFFVNHPLQLSYSIKQDYSIVSYGMPHQLLMLSNFRFILVKRVKRLYYAKLVDTPQEQAFTVINYYESPEQENFQFFNEIEINQKLYLAVVSQIAVVDQIQTFTFVQLKLFKIDLEQFELINQIKIKTFPSNLVNIKQASSNKNQIIVEYNSNETQIFTFYTYRETIKYYIQTISINLNKYEKIFFPFNHELYLRGYENKQLQIIQLEETLQFKPLWIVTPPETEESFSNSYLQKLSVLKVDKDELIVLYCLKDYYQIVRYQNNTQQNIRLFGLSEKQIRQALFFEGRLLIQPIRFHKNDKLIMYLIDFDNQQDVIVSPLQILEFADYFKFYRYQDKQILVITQDRQFYIFNFTNTYQISLLNSTQLAGSIYLIPFQDNYQEYKSLTPDQQYEIKIEFVQSRYQLDYIILISIVGIILNSFLFCFKQTSKKINNWN